MGFAFVRLVLIGGVLVTRAPIEPAGYFLAFLGLTQNLIWIFIYFRMRQPSWQIQYGLNICRLAVISGLIDFVMLPLEANVSSPANLNLAYEGFFVGLVDLVTPYPRGVIVLLFALYLYSKYMVNGSSSVSSN